MPLKLNVGLAKKIGQPDYGSLSASCYVEVELDASLIFADLESFHQRVRGAYIACSQAVHDELVRQQANESRLPPPAPSNGQRPKSGPPGASQKQLEYMHQLATQVTGLGPTRLEQLVHAMYAKSAGLLTSLEASGVIDTLKAIKDGRVVLDEVLGGAAA